MSNLELLIQEIQDFSWFPSNWDGEGGNPAIPESLEQAIKFVNLLPEPLPEPMLLGDGLIGLWWNFDDFYLDAHFTKDNRIAYYAEINGVKYKGVESFELFIPESLEALLNKLHDFAFN